MADIVEADNEDNNITEMKKEAIVLRAQVQSLDKKLKELKNLNVNINDAGDHPQKFDLAATIEALQSRQEDLRARLDALLSYFFGMGGGTDDEVEVLKTFLKGFEIKTSVKGFKREVNSLSFRFGRLVKKLKEVNSGEYLELIEGCESLNDAGFVDTDEESEEKEEEEEVKIVVKRRVMLSKKLKMVKFYYHSLFVLSSVDEREFQDILKNLYKMTEISEQFVRTVEKFCEESDGDRIFKRGIIEPYLHEIGYEDSEFEVKNYEGLKRVIGELMLSRGEEIDRERGNGQKRSFMESLKEIRGNNSNDESSFKGIWKRSLYEIQRMAIQVGALLCYCSCNFLFVISENEDEVGQYWKCFKCLLKLVTNERKDEWSSVAIKKVLSVLEFAERELVKMGKLKLETLDDQNKEIFADENYDSKEISPRERAIDQVLEMLLREVVCFDSVLSYPNLNGLQVGDKRLLKWQLSNLKAVLLEGKKEMETIGLKMHHLKTVQQKSVEDGVDLMMTMFWKVMYTKIFVECYKDETEVICRRRVMLSKKLKIVKFYCHYSFLFFSGHDQFYESTQDLEHKNTSPSLLQRGIEEKVLSQMGYFDSDFIVNDFTGLKTIIFRPKQEQDKEILEEGKQSIFEWLMELRDNDRVIHDPEYGQLRRNAQMVLEMVKGVGLLFSLSFCDFLCLLSGQDEVGQYRKCFKFLLKLMIDEREGERSGVAIKKVLSVLEFAEGELMKMGKFEFKSLINHEQEIYNDEHDEREVISSREEALDELLEVLLREVLSLESILSGPIISDTVPLLNIQISRMHEALKDGQKEIYKIWVMVVEMGKVQHQWPRGDDNSKMIINFHKVIDEKISETWKDMGFIHVEQVEEAEEEDVGAIGNVED